MGIMMQEANRRSRENADILIRPTIGERLVKAFADIVALLEQEGIGVTRIPMLREVSPASDWRHARELRGLLKTAPPQGLSLEQVYYEGEDAP